MFCNALIYKEKFIMKIDIFFFAMWINIEKRSNLRALHKKAYGENIGSLRIVSVESRISIIN